MYIWDIFLEMLFNVAQPLVSISSIRLEFPNARLCKKSNESKEWSVGLADCCRDERSDVEAINMPSFQPLKRPWKQLVYRFICIIHDQHHQYDEFLGSKIYCLCCLGVNVPIQLGIQVPLHEFAANCGTQLQFGRVPQTNSYPFPETSSPRK